jgi:hypothetical protein
MSSSLAAVAAGPATEGGLRVLAISRGSADGLCPSGWVDDDLLVDARKLGQRPWEAMVLLFVAEKVEAAGRRLACARQIRARLIWSWPWHACPCRFLPRLGLRANSRGGLDTDVCKNGGTVGWRQCELAGVF